MTSMPIYTLNQSNINDTIGNLSQPGWVKDWVKGAVNAGYVVIIPEGWVNVNQWYGTGWAQIEPTTGLGAYIITGGLSQEVSEQVISYGGSGTTAMNMSYSVEELGDNSGNLNEGLRNASVEKEEAKNRVIMNLFFPLVVPGSYLFLYAVISRYGIATLGAGVVAGALSVSMLMAPLIIYTGFVLYPDVKIWWDPYGEVYVAEARG